MKKILFTISMLAVALGFTACSSEDDILVNENQNPGKMIITAYTESKASSRTALDGDDENGYDVVWSEGDQFYAYKVTTVTDRTTHLPKKMYQRVDGPFVLKSGAGTAMGTFEKEGDALSNFPYFALYGDFPEAFSPAYLSDYYPTEQTYSKGNIKGFPMLANFSVNNGEITGPISFQNFNGILRLTVKGTATVKSIEVSASATELPTPITLNCGDGVTLTSEGIDFNIAMPYGTFTGVVITLTDTDDKTCTKKFKGTDGLVIERSQITKASFTASDFKSAVTYNVGDKVTIDGHEGIVVDLNRDNVADVIVATMNVGATAVNEDGCLGDKLAYAASYDGWSGWRLPTVDEFETLCHVDYPGVCGCTDFGGCSGAMLWDFDGNEEIDLYLPLSEYEDTEMGSYPCDKYWTGTAGNDGKYFYFAPEIDWDGWDGNTYFPIAYGDRELPYKEETDKNNTYLVRLFHDLP